MTDFHPDPTSCRFGLAGCDGDCWPTPAHIARVRYLSPTGRITVLGRPYHGPGVKRGISYDELLDHVTQWGDPRGPDAQRPLDPAGAPREPVTEATLQRAGLEIRRIAEHFTPGSVQALHDIADYLIGTYPEEGSAYPMRLRLPLDLPLPAEAAAQAAAHPNGEGLPGGPDDPVVLGLRLEAERAAAQSAPCPNNVYGHPCWPQCAQCGRGMVAEVERLRKAAGGFFNAWRYRAAPGVVEECAEVLRAALESGDVAGERPTPR